ncbi:MAG TPA: hypothetical protein VEP90_26275 [Methylomirabilota bacterium]|nr:hypothetical protein [Methylomirabilota bacterium]
MSKSMGSATPMARGYSEGSSGHGGHHRSEPKPTKSNHMNNPHTSMGMGTI